MQFYVKIAMLICYIYLLKIIHVGSIVNFISTLYNKIVFYMNFLRTTCILYGYVHEMEIDVDLR